MEISKRGLKVTKNPEVTSNKYKLTLCFLVGVVFLLIILTILTQKNIQKSSTNAFTCGDDTQNGSCSIVKPYFCENGSLIEKASACGCEESSNAENDSCVSQYETYPQNLELKYTLDGENKTLDFTAYAGLADYISKIPRAIDYAIGQTPTRQDFKLKELDEPNQKNLLLPLVVQIENTTKDKTDQLRIAVSLVQNIPYGDSNHKEISFPGGQINYSRYPYEVLFYNQGICGEKSSLMVFLLRELGYNTSILYFQKENHEAVGVLCPIEKSFHNTGYCFIETSGPAIISDSSLVYADNVKLSSEPEIIPISDGMSLPKNLYEYSDAKLLDRIRSGSLFVVNSEEKFLALKQKYGLIEEYGIK